MASRPIKFSEKMKFKKAQLNYEEVIIAYDALAVVVHPSNPVKQLNRTQLESIFRGKTTNWKQLGGDDRKIVVYSRETSSGTYEFFKESVLKNKNYMSSSLSMPATGAIIQSVSQTKGAIGYVGLAYVSPKIKTVAISYDNVHYISPTVENATKKTYPIVRPLYYYYNGHEKELVSPLLQFILSPEGQDIIKKSGYIPLN
jgi:phosphate transport system substrate-binding protein